jgi:membrane fusion protein, multidrug efflux system
MPIGLRDVAVKGGFFVNGSCRQAENVRRCTVTRKGRDCDGSSAGCEVARQRERLVRLRLFLLLVLALSLGGAGCGKTKPASSPPTVVEVMRVERRDVPIYQEWVGTLQGDVNAQIRAQVTGYLLTRDYAEGNEVTNGQLLFQIDPRPFDAALAQAKAKLAQDQAQESRTKWDAERYAPLAKANDISQQEYNDALEYYHAAQAQVKADQAFIDVAQLNLGFTRITSAIDGLAGVAEAQIGDLVGPNSPVLTTVSTINPIRAYFNPSEQDYLNYRQQYSNVVQRTAHERETDLQLILANGSTYPLTGKFLFVGREVSSTTGTILVAGLFPNPDYLLRPGQFVRVRLQTDVRHGALAVPQQAIIQVQDAYEVATVDNQNLAHIHPVTVGEQVGPEWIIKEGLQPGEQVIVVGHQKLKEGVPVNPQPFQATNNPVPASSP